MESCRDGRRMAGVGVLLALVTTAAAVQADNAAGNRPECVSVHFHAWNAGPGWNHLVTVRDGCTYAVHCRITTDANPRPSEVDLQPGAEETVNTFLYSPAPGFHPTVDCTRP